MSSIEVVAAVSAVVSAFHAGSELFKTVKKNRRTRRPRDQAQQEFEEWQLQNSLVTGEQQIGLRYMQDLRELGDVICVGDAIARDRLSHIALLMSVNIVKSLQLALTHESAILNLKLLHDSSLMNKKDAITTLDELKQRILTTRPIMRPLEGVPEGLRPRQSSASVQTLQSNGYSRVHSILDDYHPAATASPVQDKAQESRHGLTDFFRMKRSHSRSTSSASNDSIQAATINFSVALEKLVQSRASEDRSVIMRDIDTMIISYRGLNDDSYGSWGHNHYNRDFNASQDTLAILQGGGSHKPNVANLSLEGVRMYNPTPTSNGFQQRPTSGHPALKTTSNSHQEQEAYGQPPTSDKSSLYVQPQTGPSRCSSVSDGSAYSDTASSSRNSSKSSQGSNPESPLHGSDCSPRQLPTKSPSFGDAQHHEHSRTQSMAPSSYSRLEEEDPVVAPLSPLKRGSASTQSSLRVDASSRLANVPSMESNSPTPMPWPGSEQHRSMALPTHSLQQNLDSERVDTVELIRPSQSRYHYLPKVAWDPLNVPINTRRRTETCSVSAALAGATNLGTAPSKAGLRHSSWSSSTNSSVSGGLGILPGRTMKSEYMMSGPVGKDQMMEGRPCKDNNYWGFCRGAWAVREGSKKGIKLKTLPSGVYNMKKVWECATCTFQGDAFTAPHPTKRNDTQVVVDQRIHISMSGIRYRWIFLAKSHVRKKATDSISDECNYGCLICSIEGTLSSVYGGVETLMNHIALTHVAGMSKTTQEKAKCILGRVAGANEAFDINMPIFAPVEELQASKEG